jgi:lipoprotein-anchoring transpeptidase ErfK/SrfK
MNTIKTDDSKHIDIDINKQKLTVFAGSEILASYPISTAKNGLGEKNGSECTPTGLHQVRAKIGASAAENSVFIGRRPTGEVYSPELRAQYPERDWILTRILWLSGLETGKNRGGEVDTMRRYIYIHGCPDEDSFASPSSHGCVKMRNKDIIDLYDRVAAGTHVFIHASDS